MRADQWMKLAKKLTQIQSAKKPAPLRFPKNSTAARGTDSRAVRSY